MSENKGGMNDDEDYNNESFEEEELVSKQIIDCLQIPEMIEADESENDEQIP